MWVSSSKKLVKNLRWTSIILGVTNFGVIIIGGALFICSGYSESCSNTQIFPFLLVMATAGVRIFAMIRCAIQQQAAAIAVLGSSPDSSVVSDNLSRLQRRLRYKKWLWWTRFATVVTVLQFLLAMYLLFVVGSNNSSNDCGLVSLLSSGWWRKHLLVIFLIMVCFVATLQCFASSDVLRWRSFYDMQDTAWKAHYQEVFDHGIREALCCMGHVKYLTNIEEDEVNSVAQLLGDLVTYRASGTGHLEFLAGLALLQMHNQSPQLDENSIDAPEDKIQEATSFYPFAEAAYTGPLLDIGRNPILFPCAWLYRQGVFTAWSRNRRPVLQGDNWWRGHAAAFLKYVNLPKESLRCGRVNQGKCQAAYFIVVLHNIRSVVIAVRGTETPEDLITDGLCRETTLTMDDLDGLINGMHTDPTTRQTVLSSFPHYGHSGIVESARELYHQIEGAYSGTSGISAFETSGFLSSLVGAGCECDGYAVRIVGHSLGGAIGALLGIRLCGQIPNLQVYAYGPLPCVDSIIADACSGFVTSIVHDTEFSSFLSVNSILRLRAAALTTVSHGSSSDTAMISKLAQLFLNVSKNQNGKTLKPLPDPIVAADATQRCTNDDSFGSHSEYFPEEAALERLSSKMASNVGLLDLRRKAMQRRLASGSLSAPLPPPNPKTSHSKRKREGDEPGEAEDATAKVLDQLAEETATSKQSTSKQREGGSTPSPHRSPDPPAHVSSPVGTPSASQDFGSQGDNVLRRPRPAGYAKVFSELTPEEKKKRISRSVGELATASDLGALKYKGKEQVPELLSSWFDISVRMAVLAEQYDGLEEALRLRDEALLLRDAAEDRAAALAKEKLALAERVDKAEEKLAAHKELKKKYNRLKGDKKHLDDVVAEWRNSTEGRDYTATVGAESYQVGEMDTIARFSRVVEDSNPCWWKEVMDGYNRLLEEENAQMEAEDPPPAQPQQQQQEDTEIVGEEGDLNDEQQTDEESAEDSSSPSSSSS